MVIPLLYVTLYVTVCLSLSAPTREISKNNVTCNDNKFINIVREKIGNWSNKSSKLKFFIFFYVQIVK